MQARPLCSPRCSGTAGRGLLRGFGECPLGTGPHRRLQSRWALPGEGARFSLSPRPPQGSPSGIFPLHCLPEWLRPWPPWDDGQEPFLRPAWHRGLARTGCPSSRDGSTHPGPAGLLLLLLLFPVYHTLNQIQSGMVSSTWAPQPTPSSCCSYIHYVYNAGTLFHSRVEV